jgi:hypothetical protein
MRITRRQLRKIIIETLLIESKDEIEKQKYGKPKEPQVMDKVDIKKKEFEDTFDDFGDANEIVPYTPDTKSGGGFTGYYDKQKKQFLDKKRSRRGFLKNLMGTMAATYGISKGLGIETPGDALKSAIADWFDSNFKVGGIIDQQIEDLIYFLHESAWDGIVHDDVLYDTLLDDTRGIWKEDLINYLDDLGYSYEDYKKDFDNYVREPFNKHYDNLVTDERINSNADPVAAAIYAWMYDNFGLNNAGELKRSALADYYNLQVYDALIEGTDVEDIAVLFMYADRLYYALMIYLIKIGLFESVEQFEQMDDSDYIESIQMTFDAYVSVIIQDIYNEQNLDYIKKNWNELSSNLPSKHEAEQQVMDYFLEKQREIAK